jgi:predicted MFS family arabinose efflux permease
VPSASALAGAVVAPNRRGTALAIINGGTSVAVALGVPLGALVGHALGWRMTFVGVGCLASIAVVGLLVGLPRGVGASLGAPTLRERAGVAKQPAVLIALLVTTLWATGAYTVYSYLAAYLTAVTGLDGAQIGAVFFAWGIAAVTGLFVGGAINDRLGARAVMVPALALLALALLTLSLAPRAVTAGPLVAMVTAAVIVWGTCGWGFFPAQQARLMDIAGLKVAPIALSLNASFMYLGFSLGTALGSFTVMHGGVGSLGWVAALCELAALAIIQQTTRPRVTEPPLAKACLAAQCAQTSAKS